MNEQTRQEIIQRRRAFNRAALKEDVVRTVWRVFILWGILFFVLFLSSESFADSVLSALSRFTEQLTSKLP